MPHSKPPHYSTDDLRRPRRREPSTAEQQAAFQAAHANCGGGGAQVTLATAQGLEAVRRAIQVQHCSRGAGGGADQVPRGSFPVPQHGTGVGDPIALVPGVGPWRAPRLTELIAGAPHGGAVAVPGTLELTYPVTSGDHMLMEGPQQGGHQQDGCHTAKVVE